MRASKSPRKRPSQNGSEQVAVRPGDQLKVALALAIRAERKSAEQHRLLVRSEFTDFIEKQHTSVGVAQPRFRTVILAAFSMLALMMASIGIYGAMTTW